MENARPDSTQWPLSIPTRNGARRTPYTSRPAALAGGPFLDRVAAPPFAPATPAVPTRHGDPRTQPHPARLGQPQPGLTRPGPAPGQVRPGGARHASGEWPAVPGPRTPVAPPNARRRKARRADASKWNWLLWIPILLPLSPAIYNRADPTLFGVPFFYWAQLAFAFVATGVMVFVHRKVK